MDTQEIVDEDRNRNQGLQFHVADHLVVLLTDPIQCFRRLERGQGSEKYFGMTVRESRADIILYIFRLSGHWVIHMAVHYLNDHLLDQAIGHVVLYPVLIVRTDGSWRVVEDCQHVLLHVLNAG